MEEMEANEMSSYQRDPVQEVIEDRFIAETTTEGSVLSEKFGSSMVDNNVALNESHMIDLGITIQNYVLGIICMEGWWGRIAYSSPRSLSLSRKRPFSSSSAETPSVESEDLPTPGSEKRSKPNPCSIITCSDSSNLQSSSEQVTVMAGTISCAIDGLAVGIMNKLVSVLESMNPKDDKTMSDEAAVTFKTLSSLGINFTIFHDRVTRYIERAKHLSSIETTKSNKQWTADLMSCCNIEKSCYEDVASAHSCAEAALSASSEPLQLTRREASYLKELLIEAEMELASCEGETADNQARLLRVSEKLVRSKRRWENASKEAAEAVKQCVEMSAAKAAFDTAKTHSLDSK
ncbi:hypothetical protein Droror1_Dr00014087 [Drosera rotundifolia]